MAEYYCGLVLEVGIKFKPFFVSETDQPEPRELFDEKIVSHGPGFVKEVYLTHPIAKYYCAPREVVERLYPSYRSRMRKAKKTDVLRRILEDLYSGEVDPSVIPRQRSLDEFTKQKQEEEVVGL